MKRVRLACILFAGGLIFISVAIEAYGHTTFIWSFGYLTGVLVASAFGFNIPKYLSKRFPNAYKKDKW